MLDFGPSWAPWIFKNHRFSLCKTHFFEICWKTFWKATFSTKRRSKRPNGGPRWAADAESARPGEDLEGVDRDFGQRLWAETLDRDFGQRLWTDLMPEFSTLVPGGAADPPPRFARRRK